MKNKPTDSISLDRYLSSLQPGQWLTLEDLPSEFAENQALILCRLSAHRWLTWVPNHGEYCLVL